MFFLISKCLYLGRYYYQFFIPVSCQQTELTLNESGRKLLLLAYFSTCYLFYVLLLTSTFLGFRFLGLNTVTAYQRAKVYGLKIMNRGLNRGAGGQPGAAPDLHTVSGRMTGDDATEDDTMPEEAAGIEPVPSQGRHEFKLGRKLSAPSQAIRSPSFL